MYNDLPRVLNNSEGDLPPAEGVPLKLLSLYIMHELPLYWQSALKGGRRIYSVDCDQRTYVHIIFATHLFHGMNLCIVFHHKLSCQRFTHIPHICAVAVALMILVTLIVGVYICVSSSPYRCCMNNTGIHVKGLCHY